MQFIFYSFCILICYFIFSIYKDFFNPIFITSLIWALVVFSYNLVIDNLKIWRPLSDLIYIYLMIYIFLFAVSFLFFFRISYKVYVTCININLKIITILIISSILLVFYNCYIYKLIKTVGMLRIRNELLEFPLHIKLASYIQPLALVAVCYGFDEKKDKIQKIIYYFCMINVIISFFIMGSKGGLFQILFCIIFILKEKNKLSKKLLIKIIILAITLVIILQYFRASGNEYKENNLLIKTIYIYFLSPLPAMDLLINNKVNLSTNSFGGNSFSFFYRSLSKLTGRPLPESLSGFDGWVGVPYPTNVYTILGNYISDFKFWGIFLCAILYGSVFGFIYKQVKKRSVSYKIFFSIFLYCLVFQFFGDWFFAFFSTTLQYYLWSIFVTKKVRIK